MGLLLFLQFSFFIVAAIAAPKDPDPFQQSSFSSPLPTGVLTG
jgi:hypothetical protein